MTKINNWELYIGSDYAGITFIDYHAAIKMRNELRDNFKSNGIDLEVYLKKVIVTTAG